MSDVAFAGGNGAIVQAQQSGEIVAAVFRDALGEGWERFASSNEFLDLASRARRASKTKYGRLALIAEIRNRSAGQLRTSSPFAERGAIFSREHASGTQVALLPKIARGPRFSEERLCCV